MSRLLDLAGQRFGRLVVINQSGYTKGGMSTWLCRCDCGAERVVVGAALKSGNSRSCGCLGRELAASSNTTHGLTSGGKRHPLFSIWSSMKGRCCNKNDAAYAYYGGRGIAVCDRWMNDFAAFVSDMGDRPAGTSIDRIDNNGPYSPENCRWATPSVQKKNQRRRKDCPLHLGKPMTRWASELGLRYGTFYGRVQKWGWEKAISTPIQGSTSRG